MVNKGVPKNMNEREDRVSHLNSAAILRLFSPSLGGIMKPS